MSEPVSRNPSLEDYSASPRAGSPGGGTRVSEHGAALAQPAVTVVTIVRDGLKTLQRTLDSVMSQERVGIEYIVVDAQSTDGTLHLLQQNQNRIALWISESDLGISDAFNKGIALSRGEIIGLLNSDDWYEPGAIQAVVEEMQRSGADIACGRLQYWEDDSRTYLTESNPAKLDRGMTVGHPTVFVRKDCYRRFGLFRLDFRLAMDYEWLLRAKSGGARFIVLDRCLANMQGGGVGDRRWRNSQREVASARAMHVEGADKFFAYHVYVARRIVTGSVRRILDASGLGALRRMYHRWLSPVRVIANRDDGAR